ncbi:MAG: oligosaccharide flippase family protein [Anaerolineae bacterium]|nr:oligosaccharide flippase family protein [Anaerolineae bacterium]
MNAEPLDPARAPEAQPQPDPLPASVPFGSADGAQETHEAQVARLTRNATAIALATLLARGLQFGWAILLAQLLGEAGYGTWGVISGMITTAAALPEFGMGLIVLRDVARDPVRAGRYLTGTLVGQPPLALLAYLGLMGVALLPGYNVEFRLLLALAALSLFLDLIGNMAHNQLLAIEKMVTTSAILVTHIVFQIVFTIAALAGGGGLPGLYVATLLAGAVRGVLYWAALWRYGIRPRWPVDGATVRTLFRDGFPLALASFIALAYQHLDKVLAFTMLSEADAGYLTSSYVIIFGVTELVGTTALTAVYPLMSRLHDGQGGALTSLTERLAFLLLVTTVPIAVAVTTLAARLSAVFFPGFARTSVVLEITIWYVVPALTSAVFVQELIIRGNQGRMVGFRLVALALNVALNLLLLPRIGIQGAGVASVTAWSALAALLLATRRMERAALGRLARGAARVGLAGLCMTLAILALRDVSPILGGLAGVLVYLAGLVIFRALGPDEWRLVRRVAGSLPVVGAALAARFGPVDPVEA